MIQKELSLTELFGALSVIALSISVISNAYFYYSLDAMWVMSILSPAFYVSEIIKVLALIFAPIALVGMLMDLYAFILRKAHHLKPKKRYKLSAGENNHEIKLQLRLNEKKFVHWQSLFVIFTAISCIAGLFVLKLISQTTMFWSVILIGIILAIFTNEEVRKDKGLRYLMLMMLAVLSTCFSAQLKLNNLSSSPEAVLKVKDNNKWIVLDSFQGSVILLNRAENNSHIKIVKFEEIDRISSQH